MAQQPRPVNAGHISMKGSKQMKVYLEVVQYWDTGPCSCEELDVSNYTESEISEIIVKMHSKYGASCEVGCFILNKLWPVSHGYCKPCA